MGSLKLQPQKSQLRVTTDLNSLADVLAWFDQLYQPQFSQSFWLQAKLILAEGFTNAVRHAHKHKSPEVPIDLEVVIQPTGVEMRIWDEGLPFDMESFLQTLPPVVDINAPGGRGIKLMQSIADKLSYYRSSDDRNCLLLIKHQGGDNGFNHNNMDR